MDKVVIITGASSGIGLATAKYLAQKGYKVYGIAKNAYENDVFKCFESDVRDTDRIKQIFELVYKETGHIDVVINNAGFGISGAIEYALCKDIQDIFSVNAIAVVEISKIAVEYLRKNKSGRIVNIGSVAGVVALPFQACYSASKAAVENFSYALNNEVKDFGIRVICIRPGDTKTGFTSARVKNNMNVDNNYNNRIAKSVSKMEKDEQNGMSPIAVAKLIYKVISKKNPPLVATVGFSNKFICWLAKILPVRLKNHIIKKIYG